MVVSKLKLHLAREQSLRGERRKGDEKERRVFSKRLEF